MLQEERDGQIKTISKSFKIQPNRSNKLIKMDDNIENKNLCAENNIKHINDFGIDVSNVTAKWANDQMVNTLENINLMLTPNRLVAIIGPVGAGKVS